MAEALAVKITTRIRRRRIMRFGCRVMAWGARLLAAGRFEYRLNDGPWLSGGKIRLTVDAEFKQS